MDYQKFKKEVKSKEELEAYIASLPPEAKEQAEALFKNIEPRMILSRGIALLCHAVEKEYPQMKGDGLMVLAAILGIAGSSNMDTLILSSLHQTGVMGMIEEIVETRLEDFDKDKTGNSTISDILKDFKLSDN